MKIPFLDLKAQYLKIKSEVMSAFEAVCDQTAFSSGPFVESFEKNFALYSEAQYCIAVNSGTTAIHLGMLALNIGIGDEVIIPANTFIATPWGPSYVGATPVFVDCDPQTWEIDPASIESKITPKTKAIIGVHLYGQPFDVDAVKAIAEKHELFVMEDFAQAQGAKYKGKRVGALTDCGGTSFYPGKNLGAYGEGGAVLCNNHLMAERLKSLRNHGSTVRYYHDEIGYNYRMDGIQGAILDIKLRYLDSWNERRRSIAKRYQTEINNPKIKMQVCPEWAESVYHLFVITTDDRNELQKYLNAHDIYPGQHYPVPCHLQKAYAHLGYKKGDFPNAEYLAEHCLSLPMFAELSDDQVSTVIDAINNY